MNILAIDYGKKRIGLAWVDDALGVVLPYGVVKSPVELVELIEKEKIDKVIVGLPLGLEGEDNENTKIVRDFVQALGKEVKIPIELIDERLTSKQADQMGGAATRDEKAAMLILQSYLEKCNSSL